MDLISDKDFYGKYYNNLLIAKSQILIIIESLDNQNIIKTTEARIKSAKSMCEKLDKNGFDCKPELALSEITDAVGIRIICNFIDDVFIVSEKIKNCKDFEFIKYKDYITSPKPNGYRSYHIIIRKDGVYVEIQIRTISQDAWASLEHKIKYKKDVEHQRLIQAELKRCADKLASTDIDMQTIKELIDCHDI